MSHEPATKSPSELLYLDDLYVGRRFASGTHALEDVFVSLVGTGCEDWSFRNGEPSLVKS